MPGYSATQIPIPREESDFEKKCVVLFREILKDPNVKRVGRRGQAQQGADIVGHRNRDPKRLVGVQCKAKEEGKELTENEVRSEVKKALKYKPKLVEYIIVTTAKDAIKLQQLAQQLAHSRRARVEKLLLMFGVGYAGRSINEFETVREVFDPDFSASVKKTREQLEAIIGGQDKQATKLQIAELTAKLGQASNHTKLPPVYADRELQQSLSRGLRRRGFAGTDWTKESAQLAERVVDGELSHASVSLRAEAVRRAARANANSKTIGRAKELYEIFQRLTSDEVDRIYIALVADAEGILIEHCGLRAKKTIAMGARSSLTFFAGYKMQAGRLHGLILKALRLWISVRLARSTCSLSESSADSMIGRWRKSPHFQ